MHTQLHDTESFATCSVPQTFSLPHRRISFCKVSANPSALKSPCVRPPFRFNVSTLLTFLTLLTSFAATAADLKPGDSFPALSEFKLEGNLPDTTKAKVVLVDFWASWCGPCKQSFPVMEELHKRFADRGLLIIAVNVDENRPSMEGFLKKNAASFVVVRDANQKLVEKARISGMPTSFLIDHDGKVRFAHTGFRGAETKKKYEEEIESLLK